MKAYYNTSYANNNSNYTDIVNNNYIRVSRKKLTPRRKQNIKYFCIQKLIGLLMLFISYIIIRYTPEDATAIVLSIPAGIALLLTNKRVLDVNI